MAENEDSTDESQKTEDPTPRKLEEARKRGQVIFSKEVTNWVLLFAATLLIVGAGPGIVVDMRDVLKVFLAEPHNIPIGTPGGLGVTLRALFFSVFTDLLFPLGILMVAAVLSAFVQTGAIFSAESLKPDLSKISPLKGLQRLFSMRSIAEFIKGLAKIAIVSIAATVAVMPYMGSVEHFVGLNINQSLFDLESIFVKMMIAILVVLFVIAVMDYIYQRYEFYKKMRMSKQEIKDEYKQTEGDPQVKGRLRQLREQKARQRMMQAVPEADVVITNPTHYAVALKYDMQKMDAPVLVAKGADLIAQKIKELARENKVPVVENPPLARALFDSMELEQTIPAEHFKAVAEVISYVFKLKGRKV
jgi:flagellar biosynthetic protein FlhB